MLTSPVNVTIAATNGAALKANTAASDHGTRREPALLPLAQPQAVEQVIEPELPSNSPLNHVNAVAATMGNRTILQELTLNIANSLRIGRKPDENLTSLFLRIIATIEAMPQAERLQFEIRAGLKPLKITLADLLMALRKPDGQEAARLTALAEAPASAPARTAANTATTTYLEQGTSNGHAEESLAMRAAARNSAAGQSVFSAESKMRPTESQPNDAKVLQNQLKTLFEPGDSRRPVEQADVPATAVAITAEEDNGEQAPLVAAQHDAEAPATETRPAAQALPSAKAEIFTLSTANLKLDQPSLDRIRVMAQSIAAQPGEAASAEPQRPAPEKSDGGDRRVQTLLTLKGLAEAVSALPARAAELLGVVIAEATAPLPEPAEAQERTVPGSLTQPSDEEALPELALTGDQIAAETIVDATGTQDVLVEAQSEAVVADMPAEEQAEAVNVEDLQSARPETAPQARVDLLQHAVPFAYAQVQPAREDRFDAVSAEETHGDGDEDGDQAEDENGEGDGSRDDDDDMAEDEPEIVITRDSSEADRAFALYQRMGGF